ncbi:MAG: DUF7144 family membrane protein [Pseudonocardiaceae bacterium]
MTSSHATSAADRDVSGWVGWIYFAGLMMILVGSFAIIQGLVALLNSNYYFVGPEGLLVNVNFTTWGWVHLILGIVVLIAGFGVMAGNLAARVIGIVLAIVSALINLAFLAAYPLWSTIVITLDVLVIYALAVHGRELKA